MTGYIIMTKTRVISHHTSKMASVDHVQEAFLKLSVNPDFSIDLKPEQKEAVNCLLEGRDVFALMPTGFGKSFIFQLFSTAIEQKKISEGKQANSTVLVICPLTSLIQDQIKEGKSLGLNCASLQDLDDLSSDSPLPQLLFASAEKALDSDFKRILKDRSSKVHKQVELIVIDESHTVEIWTGKRNPKKEKSFRSAYGDLATLRSLSKEGTPVLALTGTADKQTKEAIVSSLLLKANTCNIFISPNRINLRINVIRTTKMEALSKLDWLVAMCLAKGVNTPKTILFCNTMKDVALLVNHLMQKIGTLAFNPPSSRRPEDCILGIYHSLSWDKYKERLVADFKVNGKKRLVVATTALSMGVNFPDIRYIVNWGPARNLLDHHQEAGRAGRDGCQSDVVVIYHGQQLTHCEDEVKEFVKSNGCLRVASYKAFDSDIEPMQPGHDCCSYCRSVCLCDGTACVAEKLPFEEQNSQAIPQNQPTMTRSVCDQDKSDLYDALLQLRETQFASGGVLFDKDASHGFSCQLCQDIVEKCSEIFTVEDLMTSFPVFSKLHAVKILEVFQEIFNDIEEVFHVTSSPCYPEQVNDFFGYFDFSSDSDSDL